MLGRCATAAATASRWAPPLAAAGTPAVAAAAPAADWARSCLAGGARSCLRCLGSPACCCGRRPRPAAAAAAPRRLAAVQRRFASSEAPKIDPYEVFGIDSDASTEQIKETYRELVKEHHPDSNPDADPSKIAEINEAYRLLMREDIKKKVKSGYFTTREGDEPPVPRSELHERVYKPAETRWEEQTQMQMLKIKRRYGSAAYNITYVLFHIFQFIRIYKTIVGIMIMGLLYQMFKGWLAKRDMQKLAQKRKQRDLNPQNA